MTSGIEIVRTGAVVTVRLSNEAKRNSVDLPMLQALRRAALDIGNDDRIQVVVLRGAGRKAFCAGADFDAVTAPPIAESVAALDVALHEAVTAVLHIPVPVIAAIEGACFGGGVQLALCADFRIANEKARFGIPAAQIGMAYPIAAIARIVRFAGAGAASKMILTGESFSAQDALRHRLIDEVVTEVNEAVDEGVDKDANKDANKKANKAAVTAQANADAMAVATLDSVQIDPAAQSAQTDNHFDARVQTLSKIIAGYDRASAVAYKAMIRALDMNDAARAHQAHSGLANAALYLPKLEAILAERANGKSTKSAQPESATATSATTPASLDPSAQPTIAPTTRSTGTAQS